MVYGYAFYDYHIVILFEVGDLEIYDAANGETRNAYMDLA